MKVVRQGTGDSSVFVKAEQELWLFLDDDVDRDELERFYSPHPVFVDGKMVRIVAVSDSNITIPTTAFWQLKSTESTNWPAVAVIGGLAIVGLVVLTKR